MKLGFVAIYSVIQLVVCEQQQDALGDAGILPRYVHKTDRQNISSKFEEVDDKTSDRNGRKARDQEHGSSREASNERGRSDDRNKEENYRKKSNDECSDDIQNKKCKEDLQDKGISNRRDVNNTIEIDNIDGRDDKNNNKDREESKNNVRDQRKDKNQENVDKYNESQNQKDKESRGKNERSNEKQGRAKNSNNNGSKKNDKDRSKSIDKNNQDTNYPGNENYQQNFERINNNNDIKENNKQDRDNNNNKKESNKQERETNKNKYNRKNNTGSNSNNNDNDDQNRKDKTRDGKNNSNMEMVKNHASNDNNQGQDSQEKIKPRTHQDRKSSDDKQTMREKDDYSRKYKDNERDGKYKEQFQNSGKSNSESRNENEDKLTRNRNDKHYSYLESLITAPNQNKDGMAVAKEKKGEVIEIHGYISKGNENNDKQVEMDVILKQKDSTSGTGEDSKGGIRIHKVLNNEPTYMENPKNQGKYSNIEKDYRELFKNHVLDTKDFFIGKELFGLISNIGQEIKEQVIEKIPGYNIIQSLDPRKQKKENDNKQPYYKNEEKTYPKVDLEVYPPYNQLEKEVKQIADKHKEVEVFKVTGSPKQEKRIDYISNKNKERVNSKNTGQEKIPDRNANIYSNMKGNQETEGYSREREKYIYNYPSDHRQDDYNFDQYKVPQQEKYNEGDDKNGERYPWNHRPVYSQEPNEYNKPYIPRQKLYDNQEYTNPPHLYRGLNQYRNPYNRRPNMNVQDYNRQNDYLYDYSTEKPFKYEQYPIPPYKPNLNYYDRSDNQYNKKSYGTKMNEGYQGYDSERKENSEEYRNDIGNIRRDNEEYEDYSFRGPHKGNPDYTLQNYNPVPIGDYTVPGLMNPISQIWESPGMNQEYQNYIRNLGGSRTGFENKGDYEESRY